jgi:hypothetical protein
MREPLTPGEPARAEKRSDAWLWTALLLGPIAMGVNTVVGYTVAHWTTDTAQKKFSYLVSAIDFVLCVCAFLISLSIHRQFRDANDMAPIDGRRQFMAKMAMLLSALSALLVIAGTIAVITLHPTD